MKSLVPQKPQTIDSRSIEVTRTYLRKGEVVSRSLWVKVSPRHPLLKFVMAPPIIGAMLAMFVLIVLMLVFALLALALFWALSKHEHEESEGQ